jgi:hypothetical protein
MIDFTTALEIAQVIRAPVEQAFLQQIGKQAAEVLLKSLSRLQVLVTRIISSTQPQEAAASSDLEPNSADEEELAARILIAAKKDPDAIQDILAQYRVVKSTMNAGRSTGGISAIASEGSALTQTVVQGDYFHIVGHADGSIPIASPPQMPTCSASARKLLSAAATDRGKVAVGIDYETILKAGELHITPDADPREEAIWKAALEELVSLAFLAPLAGSQGKIFQVTHLGCKFLEESASMSDSEA